LNERKRQILQAIVIDYINTAEPVGSRTIAKKHELGLSSATIRNEMSDLEDMGYLEQPYTSAGRIPSDKGYRLYVDELMDLKGLTLEEIRDIRAAIEVKINELNQLLRQSAEVMSRLTKYTSMAMTPHIKKSVLKSINVILIGPGKALVIIVISAGTVKNSMINIPKNITQNYLIKISNVLNEKLSGLTIGDINSALLSELENSIIEPLGVLKHVIVGIIDCISCIDNTEVYLEGTANIFNFPEFRDLAKAREFLNVLDEISLLRKLLNNQNQTETINAAGRIGDAGRAVRLFTSNEEKEAVNISIELNEENKKRQDTEQLILQEAFDIIESDLKYLKSRVLVVADKEWHRGVVGIVSSRVTEKYQRPSILISIEEGMGKGSGRSIEGFNLFKALTHCQHLLDKFGGHELAAGLTIAEENIDQFREAINEYANSVLSDDMLIPKIKVDAYISEQDINLESVRELQKLEPFGPGNPTPVFAYKGLKITDIRTVGQGKHLKLLLNIGNVFVDAIGFNMGHVAAAFSEGDLIDAAFSLEVNSWNNNACFSLIVLFL
jgi:heat-inducible transcriptional repressor